jgi:hypothetical protein
MIRSNKHLVTLTLAMAMIYSPTFTRADNASKRRPATRSNLNRAAVTTRSAGSRQPVATRRTASQTRPTRTVVPSRPAIVRPSAVRRPTTTRSIRAAGNSRIPVRRPSVTRPPVSRPSVLRPPVTREISPVRRAPTGKRSSNNPGLDDFLRKANKYRPANKDRVRISRPIGERIIEADRFNKILPPAKEAAKNKGRDSNRDEDRPARADDRTGHGKSVPAGPEDSRKDDSSADSRDPAVNDNPSSPLDSAPGDDASGDSGKGAVDPDKAGSGKAAAVGEADDEAAEAPEAAGEADDEAKEADEEAKEAVEEAKEAVEEAKEAVDEAEGADAEAEGADAEAEGADAEAEGADAEAEGADAEAEEVDADSALIILPGFTFVFGGGGHYIHETQIVETIVAVEEGAVVAANDNRIQEVANLPEVRAGSTYSLSATDLGKEPGHVVIQVNELYLDTTVDKWSNDEATVTLPLVGMAKPQRAALLMLDAEGQVVESIDVMFLPAKEDSK